MTSTFDLVLAPSTTRAVLVFRGSVQHVDAATAVRLCLALPQRVRGLRVDLRDATDVSCDATDVIRALIHSWRRARGGVCEVTWLMPGQLSPHRPLGL